MAFHSQNINVILLADLDDKLFESSFKPIHQEYFSSIARAENKVIIDH